MGHAIHKHMNSFKAKNLLSEMPIDNKASALEMDKGSAAYMKDDMAPKMESPAELTKGGKEKIMKSDANPAFKAAIAKETPVAMNQAPTMKKGSMAYKQGEKDKDDESISGKLGKKGSNISKKDRRDESLGDYGTRTK